MTNSRMSLIQAQQAHGGSHTQLEVVQDVSALLSEQAMLFGKLQVLPGSENVVCFIRHAPGFDTFLVAINVGANDDVINLRGADDVPEEGVIRATTKNFGEGRADEFAIGTMVPLGSVKLHSGEGIVVAWPPM